MIYRGQILQGINRIYSVLAEDKQIYQCRIKGKVLEWEERHYNPLACGDFVTIETIAEEADELSQKAMILEREERKNAFVRLNSKSKTPQIIAANFDQVVCVASPASPPFRPRFIDRVAVSVPPKSGFLIVLNKMDQLMSDEDLKRFLHYRDLGYEFHICSAKTGKGIKELTKKLENKISVFVGQSGVGKSSLLNILRSDIHQKVGEISDKFNRGKHTTNFAVYFPHQKIPLIDTPGIREIDIYGIEPEDLYHYFPDLNHYQGQCRFAKCLHQGEPGCAVLEAVEKGAIHEDRYRSYLNLLGDLIFQRDRHDYR